MKIEIRADGAHISGYVNATEKKSRPVITPHGKVIEEIEPKAFERAIARNGNIYVSKDHEKHISMQRRRTGRWSSTRTTSDCMQMSRIGIKQNKMFSAKQSILQLQMEDVIADEILHRLLFFTY